MNFKVEIKNLNQVLKDFDSYGKRAEDAVFAGLERTAVEVMDQARRLVPKDTTTLARSINITDRNRSELSLLVSTNTKYAAVVEFGFSGIQNVKSHTRNISQAFGRSQAVQVTAHTRQVFRKAKPYMEPAAQLGQRRVRQNVMAELNALTL